MSVTNYHGNGGHLRFSNVYVKEGVKLFIRTLSMLGYTSKPVFGISAYKMYESIYLEENMSISQVLAGKHRITNAYYYVIIKRTRVLKTSYVVACTTI